MSALLEYIILLAAIIALVLFALTAQRAAGDDLTALHLAQCLRAEADTYAPDYAPIAHVLRKRAKQRGVSLDVMTLAYCAVFDERAARYYHGRSKAIRSSTFDDPKHGTIAEWSELRQFVERFVRGKVADPCPEAMHWGGRLDVRWDGLIEVCPMLGKRGNRFYRLRRDRE